MSDSRARASARFPWSARSRLKLVAARSSNDFARWRRAISMASGKDAKSVIGRIHERFMLQFLRSVALSATEVKTSGEVARIGHAERVIERARQGERLAHARGRARRMPQQLERPGGVHRARYPRILPGPECDRPIGAVLSRIVEFDPLFQMGERG